MHGMPHSSSLRAHSVNGTGAASPSLSVASTATYANVPGATGGHVDLRVYNSAPVSAGFTTHLLPAFATVLAVIFLGEELHPYHVVGIAVVLFGVYLATSARRKAVAVAVD